jgi:hypothetical protein
MSARSLTIGPSAATPFSHQRVRPFLVVECSAPRSGSARSSDRCIRASDLSYSKSDPFGRILNFIQCIPNGRPRFRRDIDHGWDNVCQRPRVLHASFIPIALQSCLLRSPSSHRGWPRFALQEPLLLSCQDPHRLHWHGRGAPVDKLVTGWTRYSVDWTR